MTCKSYPYEKFNRSLTVSMDSYHDCDSSTIAFALKGTKGEVCR